MDYLIYHLANPIINAIIAGDHDKAKQLYNDVKAKHGMIIASKILDYIRSQYYWLDVE